MDISSSSFGKRNFTKRKLTKYIYIFYYMDSDVLKDLELISYKLSSIHSSWLIKCYPYDSEITCNKISQRINTQYHNYDKFLDKLCIIDKKNSSQFIQNTKMQIEYFRTISSFHEWFNTVQAS